MTPDQAYEEARDLCKKAAEEGQKVLRLDRLEGFEDLDRIPDGIAKCTKLKCLILGRTKITDLSPIAGITTLKFLCLRHTAVADLGPISGCTKLKWLDLDPTPVADLTPVLKLKALSHIWFKNTPATELHPELGRISMIVTPKQRISALRAYLGEAQ